MWELDQKEGRALKNWCFRIVLETLDSWASLIAQLVENPLAMQETPVRFLGREDPLEKGYATHSSIPCDSAGKESTCNAGDLGSIVGLGRSPGEGKGHPLQYSGLENSMNCIVHGVTKVGHDWATFTSLHYGSSSIGPLWDRKGKTLIQ